MESTGSDDWQTTVHLVYSAQKGDRVALECLFGRYLPRVRRIVALRLGCALAEFSDAEDIVQETLLNAFKHLDSFVETTEGSFRNWLAKCVENRIRDSFRKAKTKKRGEGKERRFGDLGNDRLSSTIFAGREPTPSQLAMRGELEEQIEAALLEMNDRYREIIILRRLCGLSYQEISAILRITVGAARKACHLALHKLDDMLASESPPS